MKVMKRLFPFLLSALLLTGSCNKEEDKMILPDIEFKTGSGYTSNDTAVAQNTNLLIGIEAAKTEGNDVLKTFNVSVSYNDSAAVSVYNQSLTAAQGDHFSTDYPITTRNQSATEKWIFTVTNRDGLINSVDLLITVQ